MTTESAHDKRDFEGMSDEQRVLDLDAGRRGFLRHVGLGLAGTALFTSASSLPAEAQQSSDGSHVERDANGNAVGANGITDVDILNFALNLEYLEAEFYLRAAFGQGLSSGDITGSDNGGRDKSGGVRGGRRVSFASDVIKRYAEEIARDEEAHVRFLRGALGSAAVPRPEIDIDGAFTTLARAAGLVGGNQEFDAYANEDNFLLAAFVFEDVGVTAYKGAAPLIQDRNVLEAAAGLLAVEAYHASEIRTILYSRERFGETNRISNLRRALSQRDDDQDIGGPDRANIVPTDNNGLAFSRSPRQVLNIVYGGVNRGSGLFLPQGANGNIRGQS